MDDLADKLIAGLRAAVERDLAPHLDGIARVRAALEAYEHAVRRNVELSLVQKAAGALGVSVDESADPARAREEVERAVCALATLELDEQAPQECSPVEPSEPPREVASPETVAAWIAAQNAEPPRPSLTLNEDRLRQRNVLRSLLSRIGKPRTLSSEVDLIDEIDALDEISSGDERARWDKLSRDHQRLWLAHLVARARHLKNRSALSPSIKSRLREVIVRFPEFASDVRPGHVNGMRPEHEPLHGTWERDAQLSHADLLVEVEEPRPREAVEEPRSDARRSRPSKITEPESEPLDWKYRQRVTSMRVVMFGGSRREDARANTEAALGIGELEWVEGDKPRRVDALASAIGSGGYDVFLLLRSFVHHKDADKLIAAAKRGGTPFAVVDAGYGVDALRSAIESALDAAAERARESA